MKLIDHFKKHLSSDIQASRKAMIDSILRDPAALSELEASRELWFDLSLVDIGQRITRILDMDEKADAVKISAERWHGFRAIEKLWINAINTYIDVEYQDVDLDHLMREESLPEPEYYS